MVEAKSAKVAEPISTSETVQIVDVFDALVNLHHILWHRALGIPQIHLENQLLELLFMA